MALQYTGAPSSRITKPRIKSTNPLLRRSSSSPFSSNPRQKPGQSKKPRKEHDSNNAYDELLDDIGVLASLATDLSFKDTAIFIDHIRSRIFADIPERGSGMGSTRIAEILNFRRSLPPFVTTAHVHALTKSPTTTEREIAELVQAAVVRKIYIPHRGIGTENVGEGLALFSEWERSIRSHNGLPDCLKDKYLKLLRATTSLTVPITSFAPTEASKLTSAGFLTSGTASTTRLTAADRFLQDSTSHLPSLTRSGSLHASGSIEAVGGADALHASGGSGGGALSNPGRSIATYKFSLPNTGPYLKLLVSARARLLDLLGKTSKYKEAPMDVLRERWDGGVAGDDAASRTRKARGDFVGVLPGKTKKWKAFYGMRFEWILEECVGAGLVELFETRSVGTGVRATT